ARRVRGSVGLALSGQDPKLGVPVPPWRPDIEGKADVVEEIVRILGVDRIPSTPFDRGENPRKPVLTAGQVRTARAKRALAARGLVEAVTWSFIDQESAELFGGGGPRIANPISAELTDMRPSLVPGLLAAAQHNSDPGFSAVGLFEVGQGFKSGRPEGHATARRARTPRA